MRDKVAVFGMLERGGEVRANVIPTRRRQVLHTEIKAHVKAGSAIYSDNLEVIGKVGETNF
jgi:hypothetical protein